jgi:hypothetical protein
MGLRQYWIKSSNLLNIKICLKLFTCFTYSMQNNSYFLSYCISYISPQSTLQIRVIHSCPHSSCLLKHLVLFTLLLWFYD